MPRKAKVQRSPRGEQQLQVCLSHDEGNVVFIHGESHRHSAHIPECLGSGYLCGRH